MKSHNWVKNKVFRDETIPKKGLWWIPIFEATYKVSKILREESSLDIVLRLLKMLSSKFVVMVLNFSKSNPTTRRALENKLFFKSSRKFSDKNSVLEYPCCKILNLWITACSTISSSLELKYSRGQRRFVEGVLFCW